MATEKYPNQNVNYPYNDAQLERARARLDPGRSVPTYEADAGGKGSRREVRPGEWVDDRKIVIGGPSSPSKDSPPESKGKSGKALPASYDPAKVYSVSLGKSAVFCGRTLSPGKQYVMAGYACTEIQPAIVDATEIADIPVDPDSQPS
jgi:hypothetical protein